MQIRAVSGDKPTNPEIVTPTYPKSFYFEGMKCNYLSRGNYNIVYTYCENGKQMVLKIPTEYKLKGGKHSAFALKFDDPERAVRLWNAINPNVFPPAKLVSIPTKSGPIKGWTCPYLTSKVPSDQ